MNLFYALLLLYLLSIFGFTILVKLIGLLLVWFVILVILEMRK